MWDSVLAQFGLLSGLETLIRSWQIRLVFACLFLLHNWMFWVFDSKRSRSLLSISGCSAHLCLPRAWPFLQTMAKWFFPCHFWLWFCHSGHNSFFKGWLPVQIIQIFRLWCFWFQEVLSVVLLVNIHHAPEMFLIWGGAKSGSSACSCKWCSQIFSVA